MLEHFSQIHESIFEKDAQKLLPRKDGKGIHGLECNLDLLHRNEFLLRNLLFFRLFHFHAERDRFLQSLVQYRKRLRLSVTAVQCWHMGDVHAVFALRDDDGEVVGHNELIVQDREGSCFTNLSFLCRR